MGGVIGALLVASIITIHPLRGQVVANGQPTLVPRDAVLNGLCESLNTEFGFRRNVPRINQGPCAPFALEFAMAWNRRFAEPATLSYVLTASGNVSLHVAVRLPDGSYFDGGNGVMNRDDLLRIYPNTIIEDTQDFDLGLLNYRSGGLFGHYERCPQYDHRKARQFIIAYLDKLKELTASSERLGET
ncbi:MAG: hypothetical protein ACPGVU_01345 [Limisphaerales bacterium]